MEQDYGATILYVITLNDAVFSIVSKHILFMFILLTIFAGPTTSQ